MKTKTPSTTQLGSLSLDLDNQWSYMKTHGDPGWDQFPSYLDLVVPRALDLFKELGVTTTFFIVGQDATLEKNQHALNSIAAAGHEIGNHSYKHEPWLHLYSKDAIQEELEMAEKVIQEATGKRPVGFRGPGYSLSAETLEILADRNYLYDASTLPTIVGPIARLYYFRRTKFNSEENSQRERLFGSFKDALRPNRPYQWQLKDKQLLEIPVTTMPGFRIPIHVSYLIYLSAYSVAMAILYFKMALTLCKLTHTPPSILLHPLDFIGHGEVEGLDFFPGMNLSFERKFHVLRKTLQLYTSAFQVMDLQSHAIHLLKETHPRIIQPRFQAS